MALSLTWEWTGWRASFVTEEQCIGLSKNSIALSKSLSLLQIIKYDQHLVIKWMDDRYIVKFVFGVLNFMDMFA